MEEDLSSRPTRDTYKSRQIVLTPHRQDDGTWVCEYVIIELVISESRSTRGYTDGSFPSSSEARVAALLTAKTIIDSRSGTEAAPVSQTYQPRESTVTDSSYNGRAIKLRSGQQEDGTWICEYTILQLGLTKISRATGRAIGSFSTRDEAEAAALEVAQGEIDSHVPHSSAN
ncbi:MAG: hypothetical protein H8K04_08885 [Nitrospira sp.]